MSITYKVTLNTTLTWVHQFMCRRSSGWSNIVQDGKRVGRTYNVKEEYVVNGKVKNLNAVTHEVVEVEEQIEEYAV